MVLKSRIAFGGGCHWCTEAVFKALKGVVIVEQGYITSIAPNDFFSEGVIVHYDQSIISLPQLIEVHLFTHKSTSNHSFREMYRSAMYWYDKEQETAFAKAIQKLQPLFSKSIITEALPFMSFKPSRESITDYYSKHPNAPFCTRYIKPKLSFLNENYSDIIKPST